MSDSQESLKLVLLITQSFLFLVVAGLVVILTVLGAPAFIWVILAAAALIVLTLVVWHARRTIYRCKACRHDFQISPWIDFVSPHLGGVKLLRCPKCGAVNWCEAERVS